MDQWPQILNRKTSILQIATFMSIMFSKFDMCVCAHECMCVSHPPTTHPQVGDLQINKKKVSLELIEIIQFCLKICNLWRLPHLWEGVWFGGWMDGLIGGVMSNN